MLVKNFYLKDIKEYEDNTGKNILSFFDTISFNNIIELIRLGNNNCTETEASVILDYYLDNTNNGIVEALLEIKKCLLGIGDNNDEDIDEEDKIDISEYKSLTDLYTQFNMQLMSVGLGYSEFWAMNTKEMYKVFNSICIKIQNETNRELSNYHTLAAMVGGAVWGKLQKEAPKVKLNQNTHKDIDDEVTMLAAKLNAMATNHNKTVNKKGE